MLGDWLYFPAILWRTETVKKYEFSGDFHTAMDLDILIRLLNADEKIAFIKSKVLGYRRHDQSASSLYAKSIGRFDEEFLCQRLSHWAWFDCRYERLSRTAKNLNHSQLW